MLNQNTISQYVMIYQEWTFESPFIEIHSNSKRKKTLSLVKCIVYPIQVKPHLSNSTEMSKEIDKCDEAIIGTDQNFDYLKLNQHGATSSLLETLISNRPVPCIRHPTRISSTTSTLIDINLYYLSLQTQNNCWHSLS